MQKSEAALKVEIDIEVRGQAASIGFADQESLFIHYAERKASPILHEVGNIGVAREKRERAGHYGFRNRRPAPGEKAVRGIPGQPARPLSREDGILQAIVDRRVCPRAGARIAAYPLEFSLNVRRTVSSRAS